MKRPTRAYWKNKQIYLRDFVFKYGAVFVVLVFLFILGNIFLPLSWLALGLFLAFWIYKGRDDFLIVMLLVILILGDSREDYFFFVKNLRIVAILLVGLRSLFQIGQGKYHFRRIFLWSIPFFIIALLGGLRSPSVGTSMSKMVSYLLLIIITLHYIPYHFKRRTTLLPDVATLGIWVFLIGLIMMVINPSLAFLLGRFRGLLGNPNGLGIYATLTMPILLICLEVYPEWKVRWQLGIFLLMASVLLSGSRTSLGTILVFYFLYWFHKRNPGSIAALWGLVVPGLILFFSLISPTELIKLLGLGEFLRVESIETGTGRFLAWTLGWNQILQDPIIGRGFAYEEIYFHGLRDILVATEHQGGMHNSWLTFIMNNGLLGFGLFLIFFLNLLFRMKSRAFALPFALAALVSATFESWLNSSLNAFSIHFYLVVMLLVEWPQFVEAANARKDKVEVRVAAGSHSSANSGLSPAPSGEG